MIDIGTYDYSEDIDLPKWSDYAEIETFQDYELTQCIVYELAIRNPRYKEEVDFVMEFYTQFKEEIDISIVYLSKPRKGFISPDPKLSTKHPYHGRFSELKKLILNIEVIPFNLEENTLAYRDPKIFGEKFYKLLDFIMENKPKNNLNISVGSFMSMKKPVDMVDIAEGDGFYIETKTKSNNGTGFNIPENCDYASLHSIMSSVTSKDFYDHAKKYDEVSTSDKVSERLKKIDVLNSHIRVYEKFKRPKLKLNRSTSKNIMAEIDLSRSEKEISAYIKHVKEAIKKNIDIVTPLELLASLFEPNDETFIFNEEAVDVDSKASTFAKKLFKYDFITTQIKNNEANNSFYKKQIQTIQERKEDDFYLNKTERIQEAEAHYAENKAITSAEKLFNDPEILKKTGAKSDTVRLHYRDIRKLLIDERYKKLNSHIL